jgi:hypothetical protein
LRNDEERVAATRDVAAQSMARILKCVAQHDMEAAAQYERQHALASIARRAYGQP